MRLECGCVMPLRLCAEAVKLRDAVGVAYARYMREQTAGAELSHKDAVRAFIAHKSQPPIVEAKHEQAEN